MWLAFGKGGVLALAMVVFGALLPDMDHPKSFINKKLFVTKAVGMVAQHRGLLHSGLAVVLAFLASYWLFSILGFGSGAAYWLGFGYFAHLVADSFNITGVKWFQPFSDRKFSGPVTTGGYTEVVFLLATLAGIVVLLF